MFTGETPICVTYPEGGCTITEPSQTGFCSGEETGCSRYTSMQSAYDAAGRVIMAVKEWAGREAGLHRLRVEWAQDPVGLSASVHLNVTLHDKATWPPLYVQRVASPPPRRQPSG